MECSHIRNFCIIAHIDHGKSTLADRMLEYTGTIASRDIRAQTLDQMDLERERGITIKLAPVRMRWRDHVMHLIDTPGHVDFTYEVSRSLAAVEGAVLLVDATQGVQAQTIANLYLALGEDITIVPAVNKIDLPNADVDRTIRELVALLGCTPEEVLRVSGKTGDGVPELLDAILDRVPFPRVAPGSAVAARNVPAPPLRALIFDSLYDDYRGVVAYVRVVDGAVTRGDRLQLIATRTNVEALEVGTFAPKLVPLPALAMGEIGYIVTGLKDIRSVRVGDTITSAAHPAVQPVPGYAEVTPMVYAGVFPKRADDTAALREGIERLRLNDAALTFEPERSSALGVGFRCGFLGLLHLDVVRERILREANIETIITVPSVAYIVHPAFAESPRTIRSPQELPDPSRIASMEEPWVRMDVVTPESFVGGLMQLCQERRGVYQTTEYLGASGGDAATASRRVILRYELPLAAILVDFYDRLKSISQGYASMNYERIGYRIAAVRRLDILVADEHVEALSSIVYEDDAAVVGRRIVERLRDAIPRAQFEIRIQAALGGKIVAAERVAPLRKDVLAKMSGGDVTRKMKLLQKQRKGKQQMRSGGHVDLPPEAYLAVLKRG
ncbi:elongation factor 4 [Candidatus Uhrbacteria bacterium]|nr:elongation factor 4 [Candidatus Uhrbacteria bacterium]